MATRVIIVRHGQSSYNAAKRIQGRCDESVLTEKGRADAQTVGATLKNYNFHGFYCSPLQRAKQTATIIHSCLNNPPPLQPTGLLQEIDLPLWEGWDKDEVKAKFPEEYRCWKERPQEFKMEVLGKTHFPVSSLYTQGKQFWQEIIPQHMGRTILIVAHNGINRCLIMSALSIPISRYHSLQQSNCSINVLNFTGGWAEPVQLESLNQTSHLGIPLAPPRPPRNRLRLLLVRHGETEWNRASVFQGIKDIPLNDTGREQGKKAGDFLKEVKIDFAISSHLLRPKQTAQIILQHHPDVTLEVREELQEICHGLWEGKLEREIEAEFTDLLRQWKEAPETVQMPEGENLQQVWDRAIACWEDIVKTFSATEEEKTGLIVAHDAINKVIICNLLGLTTADFWLIKQGNGSVSVIDYPQGALCLPVLQGINITTHLSRGILDTTAAGAL